MNFGLFIVVAALCLAKADILNRLEGLREKTREMFYHGFNGYLKHAFPFDELEPQSCTGLGLDHSKMARRRLGLDRVLNQNDPEGSFEIRSGLALTLIDSLDTLAFLGDRDGFHHAAKLFLDTVYNFEIDNVVLVFEINIRVLGALLSAHLFLSGQFDRDSGIVFRMGGYQGEMLKLAVDLGERLLPAFNSPTGIPYSKINLHSGLPPNPNPSNCPAAAGSFILEFGLLSFLTGDPRYYVSTCIG